MNEEERNLVLRHLHDMNNALCSITGYIDMIKDDNDINKIHEYARHIDTSVTNIISKMSLVKEKVDKLSPRK